MKKKRPIPIPITIPKPLWYSWQTALRLVQASGRSIRSVDDWAKTYVLDSAFERFIGENKLPGWFRESINDMNINDWTI